MAGARQWQGGFATRSQTAEWLDNKVMEVAARKLGDPLPRPPVDVTVAELVEKFLASHDVDAATTRKLRSQLKHATAAFGPKILADLRPLDLAA